MKRLLAALTLCTFIGSTQVACTKAQVTSVVTTVSSLLQYVTTFIQGAQIAWPIIASLLGTSQQAGATALFDKALQAVTDGEAAVQDAVNAAKAANETSPDLTAVIAQVQASVAQVISIISSYETNTPAGSVGASVTSLQHQATVIAHWGG